MVYIALLRGINVGGKNKINIKVLKGTFERIGMTNVVTYINSGNIIFEADDLSIAELSDQLSGAILEDFKLEIKVVVRHKDELEQIINSIPVSWQNNKKMRSDVLFLWDEVDDEAVLEKLMIRPEVDVVSYVPGAVLWSINRTNAGKSGLNKLAGTKLYKQMTIRKVNTVRKVFELMPRFSEL